MVHRNQYIFYQSSTSGLRQSIFASVDGRPFNRTMNLGTYVTPAVISCRSTFLILIDDNWRHGLTWMNHRSVVGQSSRSIGTDLPDDNDIFVHLRTLSIIFLYIFLRHIYRRQYRTALYTDWRWPISQHLFGIFVHLSVTASFSFSSWVPFFFCGPSSVHLFVHWRVDRMVGRSMNDGGRWGRWMTMDDDGVWWHTIISMLVVGMLSQPSTSGWSSYIWSDQVYLITSHLASRIFLPFWSIWYLLFLYILLVMTRTRLTWLVDLCCCCPSINITFSFIASSQPNLTSRCRASRLLSRSILTSYGMPGMAGRPSGRRSLDGTCCCFIFVSIYQSSMFLLSI